jgi:membrane protease YdiL (CAAX protease family)
MNNGLDPIKSKKWLFWSSLYGLAVLVIGGYLNHAQPYSSAAQTNPPFWVFILWGSLYLPLIVLPLTNCCKVTDFGFSLNTFLAIAALLATAGCVFVTNSLIVPWNSAAIEAFARTGEEVFFRGFLFYLFTRLFEHKLKPWLWAALTSSVLFALIHTQTFQQAYLDEYGSPNSPILFTIIERLVNVFIVGFIFALIRVWTRSILPGAIAHSLSSAGILALPFVLIFYFGIIGWARLRSEPMKFELKPHASPGV